MIEHPAEQDYPGPCTLGDYVPSLLFNQVIEHPAEQDYPGPCTLGDYGPCVTFKPSD